ncbi:MAG: 50S ribosomal protein L9 [Spirochaetales bacterium]|nr:50S ribosomal protein L9 [Spirochaetales bacterium]
MKIILYKDVPNLGEEGDVKIVADGYARNFLIPQKFAVRYTKATETELAQKQQAIARRKAEKSKDAADQKTRIEGMEMKISVAAGEKGKLFGSVTSTAIVDWLRSEGVEVERKRIELPEGGIKVVGSHTVRVKLYGGSDASLKVEVAAASDDPAQDAAPEAPAEEDVQEEVAEEAADVPAQDEAPAEDGE